MDADKLKRACRRLLDKHAQDTMREPDRASVTSIAVILVGLTDVRLSDKDSVVAAVEVAMGAWQRIGLVEMQLLDAARK